MSRPLTTWQALEGRTVALAAALAFVLAGAAPVQAQSWRVQGAWVAGEVGGALIGAEFRRPLGSEPPLPLPLPGRAGSGPIEAPSRAWHLTGMAGLGVNGAPAAATGRSVEPLGYLHAGVLYRTGRSVPGYLGVVGAGYLPASSWGPALVVEAQDVAALQVGAMYGREAWRGYVALALVIRFLEDVLGG